MNTQKPSKSWAYVVVFVGGLLLLGGVAAVIGYLGLPFTVVGEDILGQQLGQMAGMFLGIICGSLAVFHGLMSILNRASRPLKLPPVYFFAASFAVLLGAGNLVLNFDIAPELVFPPLFLLGAALPTVGVVAWATRGLGWPITWRQASLALAAGSTLSIVVTLFLGSFLPYVALLLVEPLGFMAGSFAELFAQGTQGLLERLFFSPVLVVFLISIALQAPIPEEFAKALSLPIFGRQRVTNERQAFAIGLASGAGFAILENMLYEGLYAQWSGWSWGGVTLLRAFGSVLHPLATGLVALGWFRVREHGIGSLIRAYLVAIGIHTLGNGGFEPFVYLTGFEYYADAGRTFSFYGEAIEALLVAFLIALSVGLWWILRRLVNDLAGGITPRVSPEVISRRALAVWAFACALVVIPIGAALGPAWADIQRIILVAR